MSIIPKILHLEDDVCDAELVAEALTDGGLKVDITLVSTGDDFVTSLNQDSFDLIISDYKLPSFDGSMALSLAREICPATPFIVVSGTVGEEAVVEMMKQGATDFVLKGRLNRLALAVRRALAEVAARNEKLLAEKALRKSEDQLRQAQKLEAIGQLAGGIAHDFNNLLTVINGRSQLMMTRLKPGDKMRSELELIYKTGERAAKLTRQLLAFSRQQVLEPRVICLNTVAVEMEKMLRRLIPENIELMTSLDQTLGRVKVDPSQIEQVILNLVVNARDAMPNGGKLVIETANKTLNEDYCRARTDLTPGRYVRLAVSDTGHGMSDLIRARIFEPFFTTKGKDKGTGLGLSTVFGIVKQSHGHIEVYSEVGKGTSFKIYFPQTDESASMTSGTRTAVPEGKEVILIVEDEKDVRDFVRDLLEANNYLVLLAQDGNEALSLCESHKDRIDLLVSDVVMPNLGGPELVEKLRPLHPETKLLFMSGYTDRAIVRDGVLESGMDFIHKPFTPQSLARKVREVLDKS
jgi:signal transduction histidine kinase